MGTLVHVSYSGHEIRRDSLRSTTYAIHTTWLLESNVDLKTVSQRLGHSSITVTADVYSHVTKKMQREAMNKLEQMMGNEQGE